MSQSEHSLFGIGIGLRAEHAEELLSQKVPGIDWLEVLVDNVLDAHSGHTEMLQDLRENYPLVLHGVSLNIGSTDSLNNDYLQCLKSLADRLQPAHVSDHLCWNGINGTYLHDLLPVPYTAQALAHIAPRIETVQQKLGRQLVLENPSSYATFRQSEMPEWEFLSQLCAKTGCGLLLDVNNIYVSGQNHGFDPLHYLQSLPAENIAYLHLAGHDPREGYLLDSHRGQVADAVWELYGQALQHLGPKPTLIEWDIDIPPLSVLQAEAEKARSIN